jgi:hypothetical protein
MAFQENCFQIIIDTEKNNHGRYGKKIKYGMMSE